MITHEIKAFAEPAPYVYTPPVHHVALPPPHTELVSYGKDRYKGKLAYARFLQQLTIQKGDYICRKNNSSFPFKREDYWRVQDIQEIHGLADFNIYGTPKCLYLVNGDMNHMWVAPDEIFKVHSIPTGWEIGIE